MAISPLRLGLGASTGAGLGAAAPPPELAAIEEEPALEEDIPAEDEVSDAELAVGAEPESVAPAGSLDPADGPQAMRTITRVMATRAVGMENMSSRRRCFVLGVAAFASG